MLYKCMKSWARQNECISIGILVKGVMTYGLIYDPVRDELFTAEKGHGAQLNQQRIRVSETTALKSALVTTGFPFKSRNALSAQMKMIESLFMQVSGIRRMGSAALDLAYVAAGRVQGHWSYGLQPWDIAAGSLLVKEAGGLVFDFLGQADYMNTGNIIAGNAPIATALHHAVSEHFKIEDQVE